MRFPIFLLYILSLLVLTSCGSRKRISGATVSERANLQNEVVENAVFYLGTQYEYGGTTKRGMDCSGLIYTAFSKEDMSIPRTSRAMSLEGDRIDLEEAMAGDLLFFQTNKNRKVINHVGLITKVTPSDIFFIHSTTSLGVIISRLKENYWNEHFVMARRIQ